MARNNRPRGIRPGIANQQGGPPPAAPSADDDPDDDNPPPGGSGGGSPRDGSPRDGSPRDGTGGGSGGGSGGDDGRGDIPSPRGAARGIHGIPNSDLSGLADGEYTIDGYDVYVSTDSNGYRHVRVPFVDAHGGSDGTRFLLRTTRPDGSMYDQEWDVEKSKPVRRETSYSSQDITSGLVPNIGGPGLGMVTRENAVFISQQDTRRFAGQLNQTADSPAAEAARLDTLAENARALAAKWSGSDYGGDAANAGAMFEELAGRLDEEAETVRTGVKNAATGDPTNRSLNDSNAWYVMDADAGYFKASSQDDALPGDAATRAARLTALANMARATAEKWDNATISAAFTDADGNVVKAGDYFRSWATDLTASAADNRAIATRNADVEQAKTTFTTGSRGLPATFGAPEVEGSAGFFQDHLSTVQNQRDYAQGRLDRWSGNPQDELIRIPGDGPPGHEEQLRPSQYWQSVLDSLQGQQQTINTAQQTYNAEVHRNEVEFSLDHLASTRLSRPKCRHDCNSPPACEVCRRLSAHQKLKAARDISRTTCSPSRTNGNTLKGNLTGGAVTPRTNWCGYKAAGTRDMKNNCDPASIGKACWIPSTGEHKASTPPSRSTG